ncbi:ketosynthase [Stenotrophomonas pictorum]|nr:ketosynthase [Stenotrophomonas pictorum]
MAVAPPSGHGAAAALIRMLLLLAYPLLSHVASLRSDGIWAAAAMFSLVLLLLLAPLAQRRGWALPLLLLCTLALVWLAGSPLAWMLLLAPPVVFPLLVAWGFARTLGAGQVPLIGRIMRALYQRAGMPVTAALERYTRQLTGAWVAVLVLLAALNLALAASAVPGGLLVMLGLRPWWPVTHEQWSWCANIANWGLIGGFFVLEYALRTRLFPDRPDRNAVQFARQMAQLGPAFWRDLLR